MSLVQRIVSRLAERWFPPQPVGFKALFTFDGPAAEKPLAQTSAPVAVDERCPEIGCLTCSPVHHPADVTRVFFWLREGPLAADWYFRPAEEVISLAKAILTLQRGVEAGKWKQ